MASVGHHDNTLRASQGAIKTPNTAKAKCRVSATVFPTAIDGTRMSWDDDVACVFFFLPREGKGTVSHAPSKTPLIQSCTPEP